jgi:hypothetical protein
LTLSAARRVGKLAFAGGSVRADGTREGRPFLGLANAPTLRKTIGRAPASPMKILTPAVLVLLGSALAFSPRNPASLRALGDPGPGPALSGGHGAYTTSFPLTESPISDQGNWEGGKTAGVDWADIATIPGHAFGLESGASGYDDSTALLTGSWGPNQTAQATVYTVNQNDKISEEVELRLRSSLSPHSATGYEINFRCLKTKNAYTEIVRWNGPLGDFSYLSHKDGAQYGVADGDVVRATMVGNVITVYINGVQVAQATDGTFATGRPGIGFFIQGALGVDRDYGFTSFEASDGP